MSASSTPWGIVTATATGGSHRSLRAPNQDAIASFETDTGSCLAVADGHGGPRYVRSDTGSRIAVAVARRLGAALLAGDVPLSTVASTLPGRLVSEWRSDVAAHLTAHPLDAETAQQVGPDPFVAYGTTLMVVLCTSSEAVALQLGDGDITAVSPEGTCAQPVAPDSRNVAGQTTSMCLSDAVQSFRIASLAIDGELPHLVVVSTDGYGNSFTDPAWFHHVGIELSRMERHLGVTSVVDALPEWVQESARVGGDDTTVGVLFRSGVVWPRPPSDLRPTSSYEHVATSGSAPTVGDIEAAVPRAGRRRSVLTGTLALCLGAAAGWFLARTDADPRAVSGSVPDVTTRSSTVAATDAVTEAVVTTAVVDDASGPPTTVAPERLTLATPSHVVELSLSGSSCTVEATRPLGVASPATVVSGEDGLWVADTTGIRLFDVSSPNELVFVPIEGVVSLGLTDDRLLAAIGANPNEASWRVATWNLSDLEPMPDCTFRQTTADAGPTIEERRP